MKEFMFLLRGGDSGAAQFSPEQMQQHIEKYFAWIDKLRADGSLKSADPLEGDGMIVSSDRKAPITDGPFAESKEAVGGYFLIYANDLDHAADIARGCPVIDAGGVVEVRPIAAMPTRS